MIDRANLKAYFERSQDFALEYFFKYNNFEF